MKDVKEYKSEILCPEFVNRRIHIEDGNLLVHQKLFWPCWRYTVTITCNMKEKLNPFEKVVLELSNSITNDSERIAFMTGIDIDMVKFTQQLLQTKLYLNEAFDITAEGKSVLKEDEENVKDYFFLVYQEAYTGDLLPVIEEANQENLNSGESWDHKAIKVNFEGEESSDDDNVRHFYVSHRKATVGEESLNTQLIYSVSYPPYSEERSRDEISSEKISKLIKQLMRKGQVSMSKVSGIRVAQSRDAVLVLTDYGIDNNNTRRDNLTNGFDKEWSLLMGRALSLLFPYDQKYITKIRKDAETSSEDFTTTEESEDIKKIKNRWWFNNQIKKRLIESLAIIEDYHLDEINNKSDNKYFDFCSRKLVVALYEALQFAFYQAAKDSLRYAATVRDLNNLDDKSIGIQCFRNLKNMGYIFDDRDNDLRKKLRINPQKLLDSVENDDSIALWNVITFCALECSNNDTREIHVLKVLGNNYPYAFKTIFFINDTRNTYQHKTKDAVPLTEQFAKKAYSEVCKILEVLLPARYIDKDSGLLVTQNDISRRKTSSAYMEKLFKAQNNIELFFGRQITFMIPEDIYNELENTEMHFVEKEDIDSQLYFSLSIIMQSLFFKLFLKEPYEYKNLSITDCQNIRRSVLADAIQLGFSSDTDNYPILQRTNPHYIRSSYVNRVDNTLGADCILWLYLAPKTEKENIAKAIPDLLKLTNRLVELRGHNGTNTINCSIEELLRLKERVYSFAKYVVENGQLSV